jgi:hypothetical protein
MRDIEFYRNHLNLAQDYKAKIEATNNAILEYTDPVSGFSTRPLDDYSRAPINSSIVEARISFKNFISYALFGEV